MKRYSAQLSFTVLVAVFLTVTVGEGQAYNVETPQLSPQLEASASANGFFGKPQIFSGQTILTGEVQQSVAIIYQVEPGDSILAVAKRYNLSVGTILDANNISPTQAEKIKPGTQLIIPAQDTNTSTAWLNALNQAKQQQQQAAETARKAQLAQSQRSSTSRTSNNFSYITSGYEVIGRLVGGYNGGYPGQCTWYVNYKRPDLPNGMGNGGQYLASARAKGLPTGSLPRPGAVMVTAESAYGHVAYVEGVSGSSVTVSEMNFVGPYIVSRRTIPIDYWAIKGYIY